MPNDRPTPNDAPDPSPRPTLPETPADSAVSTRRYWLKAGVAAPTVLLTLASRPVFGVQCRTASAFTSLNTSVTGRGISVCNGLTPQQWCAGYRHVQGGGLTRLGTRWPPPYVPVAAHGTTGLQATLFHSPVTGLFGDIFHHKTFLEVLELPGGGLQDLGKYIAAAMLNARSGRTPMLDETRVRQMWNDYVSMRSFEPTAGVRWDIPQIVLYIRSTMG